MRSFVDANRANWDERADIHAEDATGFYRIDRLIAGEDVLSPVEAGEIGDIAGLNVLHLQCHIGTDTICLARRGGRVTGIDFSTKAIRHAESLAAQAGVTVRFIEGDVYRAYALAGGGFDLVYTTWGTIVWLPDVRQWADVVATVLRPGGRLLFADTHPGFALLEEVSGQLVPTYDFRTSPPTPLEFRQEQTYTGDQRTLHNAASFEWIHPVGDILTALIDVGMRIERATEHEVLPFQMFPMMERGDDRMWRLPADKPRMPLSLSIGAVKAR